MNIRHLLVLIIISAIALHCNTHILTLYAQQPDLEVLVNYDNDQDITTVIDLGCYVERVFSLFNIVLARCPRLAVDKLRQYFLVTLNFGVDISTTFGGFKSVLDLASLGQRSTQVPTYWSWAVSRTSADVMWEYLREDGSDTVIAILDTGIDPNHPLVSGKIVGWAEFDSKGRPICSRPRDTHGHGTWVASIAAGGDGTNYIFGVAPNAKLLVALVLPYGSGTAAQVLAGLEWALDPYDTCTNTKLNARPAAVSMSFGALGNYSNVFLPAIRRLIENGIVPVAAIGNGGPYSSSNPGNIWGVIGVGATDLDNDVALFSSYEEIEWPNPPNDWPFKGRYPRYYKKPDIVAPGVEIPGAFPGDLLVIGSGTSAATPIIAGLAAIVSTKLRAQGITGYRLVEAVYDIITSTATPIDHPGAGSGLVDAYKAVAKAKNVMVKTIRLEVHPKSTRPLDKVALRVEGIEVGATISVFLSGVRVYEGLLTSVYIPIDVPLTHLGGNTLVVVDERGRLYGKTLVYVVPRLIADAVCLWGKQCDVFVSGIGIGDTIIAYLDNTIMTLYFADLRGTCNYSFITPFAETGFYNLTVVDVSNPQILLKTRIYINSSHIPASTVVINKTVTIVRNQTTVISNIYAVPVYVRAKGYYLANTTDFVDIYTHRGFIESASITAIDGDKAEIHVLNITPINDNLYRAWLKIGSIAGQEAYATLNLSIALNGTRIPYIAVIRVLSRDPYKHILDKTEQLSESVHNNTSLLNRIKTEVSNLWILANRSIDSLYEDLEMLRERIVFLENYARSLHQQMSELQKITSISIALGIASMILCISLIIRHRMR